MNIYEKIAKARVAYAGMNIKKSGKNDYAGYAYYELCDILPAINKIGEDHGFLCEVSFTDTLATMTVRNTEKPEDVAIFTSPMSKASLKGCHEVQNLGAVETYIKRYLYQNAFEIVEADSLDKSFNPNKPPLPPPLKTLTPEQRAAKQDPDRPRILVAQSKLGWDNAMVKAELDKRGGSYKQTAEYMEGVVAEKEIAQKCEEDEQAIVDQAAKNVQKTFSGEIF